MGSNKTPQERRGGKPLVLESIVGHAAAASGDIPDPEDEGELEAG